MTSSHRNADFDRVNEIHAENGSDDRIDYTQKITDHRFRVHHAPSDEEALRILIHDATEDDLKRLQANGVSHYEHGEDHIDVIVSIMPPIEYLRITNA